MGNEEKKKSSMTIGQIDAEIERLEKLAAEAAEKEPCPPKGMTFDSDPGGYLGKIMELQQYRKKIAEEQGIKTANFSDMGGVVGSRKTEKTMRMNIPLKDSTPVVKDSTPVEVKKVLPGHESSEDENLSVIQHGDKKHASGAIEIEDVKRILKDSEAIRQKSSDAYDSIVKTISTGGIGIAFAVLTFLLGKDSGIKMSCAMKFYFFGAIAVWAFNLVYMMILERRTQNMLLNRIKALYARTLNADKENALGESIHKCNFLNGVIAVAGIGVFALFVLLVMNAR